MVCLTLLGHGLARAYRFNIQSSSLFSTLPAHQQRPLSIVFYGSDKFSLASLSLLHARLNECDSSNTVINRLEVVSTSASNPVSVYCGQSNLVCHQFHSYHPPLGVFNLGVVSSFGRLIPKSMIQACSHGMLNIHGSLLPRWRGASPIQQAILAGDKLTGLTIMRVMPARFDVGDIVAQETIEILYRITAMELKKIMAPIGARLLWSCIENLEQNLANARPQTEEGVTHAPKLRDTDGLIDWNGMDAFEIDRRYRAFTGFIDTHTLWIDGSILKLGDIVDPHLVQRLELPVLTGTEGCHMPGLVWYHRKRHLVCIASARNTWSAFRSLTFKGRRRMSALGFFNTFIRPTALQGPILLQSR